MITFEHLPSGIRVPGMYVEIDNTRAAGAGQLDYNLLVVGQKTEDGLEHGKLQRVFSADEVGKKAGRGSMLHRMAAKAFRAFPFGRIYVLPLEDDESATAATGEVELSGEAAESGTLAVYVGGRRYAIGVADGDSGEDLAEDLAEAISDDENAPVTATRDAGKVTLEAKNAGEVGNSIDIRVNHRDDEDEVEGVEVTLSEMEGGATDPDFSEHTSVLEQEWFQLVAMPYHDGATLDAFHEKAKERWGPTVMEGSLAVSAATGTMGELIDKGNNSPYTSILDADGYLSPTDEVCASLAAVVAREAQEDPARPFQTLSLPGIMAPHPDDVRPLEDRNALLGDGISTARVDASGNVMLDAVITTYLTNQFGASDESYLYANTLFTLMFIRWDWETYWQQKYPRHKLADDGTRFRPGQPVVTPKLAKAEAQRRFRSWELDGLVEGFEQFQEDLVAERPSDNPNRLNVKMSPNLMNQLRVVGTKVSFLLQAMEV